MNVVSCFFLMAVICLEECIGSKLLKVPRIYNALITSDEELVPSQAYPAVAPVLRPSGPLYLSPDYEADVTPSPLPPVPPVKIEDSQWQMPKNNKPSNPDIPDVPPPPLPVSVRQGKS